MRGLKQRIMPASDAFVATCSVCGAALRQVHVLRGAAGPRCSFCGSPLVAADQGVARSGPPREDESPLGLLTDFERPRRAPRGVWIALAIALLMVVAAGSYLRGRATSGQEARPPADQDQTEPAPGGTGTGPRRFTHVRAVVDVTATGYVLATVDDEVVQEGTFAAGDGFTLRADDEITLQLADAGSVQLEAGGREIRTGADGQGVELRLWLDRGRVRVERTPAG